VRHVARRRGVDRRIVGAIDHVFADHDQIAANREIVNGAAVILGVDDRRRLSGKPGEILIERQAGDVEIGWQERFQRDWRGQLVGANKTSGQFENALVDGLEEMLRLEEVGNAVECFVVDQNRAQERLFSLDIMRRRAKNGFRG
jgi:hypothetical protein